MIKVAVIMAVYNCRKYIKDSIDSILNQSFKDWVLYIGDDCSDDGSYDIAKDYENDKVIILKTKTRSGLAGTRNLILKNISEAYPCVECIAIQDADDVSHPERLQIETEFLDQNSEYGLTGSFYSVIAEGGKVIKHLALPVEDNEIRKVFFFQNWFGHGSILFRKSILDRIGYYDENFEWAHDYDLIYMIMTVSKVYNIPQYLYCWRQTAQNINKVKMKKQSGYQLCAHYKSYCKTMGIEFDLDNYIEKKHDRFKL